MNRIVRLLGICFCFIAVWAMSAIAFAAEGTEERFSLADCLQYANQNSEKLKSADLAITQSQHQLNQALAGKWPTLGYDLYQSKNGDGIYKTEYNEDYKALSLTQNLYTGGKISAGIQQARLRLDNALEDRRQTQQQLIHDVKQAYYLLWLAQQKLAVAQTSYDNMGKHFHNVEQKYQEGLLPKIDLLQAEVNWRKLKPDLISANNEVASRRSNLALLIGKKDGPVPVIDADSLLKTELPQSTVSAPTALETAYRERPEMRQMKNNLELAKVNVVIARADYYPALALSASYQDKRDDGLYSAQSGVFWALKLDLSGTLFNGMATRENVAAAQTGVQKQLSSETQLKDNIRLRLEEVFRSVEESKETIEVNKATSDLAVESLRLTQIKLDEGLATNTDLMDAQLDVDQALNGYYSAVCNYLNALADLDLVLGKD